MWKDLNVKEFKSFLHQPSLIISSDLEPAEMLRNRAAEFGRYVSSVAESSIKGRMMP